MKRITFLLFLVMTFYPLQKTVALSCDKPPPPEVAVHEYDVVVLATIVDKIIDENMSLEGFNTVKAEVSHPIKGYNQKLIPKHLMVLYHQLGGLNRQRQVLL